MVDCCPRRGGHRGLELSYNWAAYDPATSCVKQPKGMSNLMEYLLRRFLYSRSLGICNCRNIGSSSTRSHHSECRAGDWGIPTGAGGAFIPALGDPVHELLGPHGKRLGLDHLILNRRIYSARSPNGRHYSGVHPHNNHAHIGINHAGAERLNMATLIDVLGDIGPGIPLPPGDSMDNYIEQQQLNLNAAGFKGANGKVLTVDNIYGPNTAFDEASRDAAEAATVSFDTIRVLRRVTP